MAKKRFDFPWARQPFPAYFLWQNPFIYRRRKSQAIRISKIYRQAGIALGMPLPYEGVFPPVRLTGEPIVAEATAFVGQPAELIAQLRVILESNSSEQHDSTEHP